MQQAFLALGVIVACAQFVYLTMLVQERPPAHRRGIRGSDAVVPASQTLPSLVERPKKNIYTAVPRAQVPDTSRAAPETDRSTARAPKTLRMAGESVRSEEQAEESSDVASRIALVTEMVRSIHIAFAHVRPAGFGLRNSLNRPTDFKVWQIFYDATSQALFGSKFGELRAFSRIPTRKTAHRSIFVSISSFRDEVCPDTLDNLWAQAAEPERIAVGLVQQNCDEAQHAAYGCFTAVMPEDKKVHVAPPDLDCASSYCMRPHAFPEACRPGSSLLRVLRFNESETFGPVFGRYLGSLLWRGETYYMQVDAHTTFAKHWDTMLLEDYAIAPSPKAVFSHYPPSGPQRPATKVPPYAWEGAHGTCMCDAGFAEYSIVRVGAMKRYPIRETFPAGCTGAPSSSCRHVPRFAPYIGAGFVFANASFLIDVPFDPFTPFIFMGEELDFSTRLWTSGWDIFCPPRNVVAHAYLRPQKPKFWGALQRSIGAGAHNSLQAFVLPRVKHKVGYPELANKNDLATPTLAAHLDLYGIGRARPLSHYLQIADLDLRAKRHANVAWCEAGDRPPTHFVL